MSPEFPILHWILTLVISPITSELIPLIWGNDPRQVIGLLEMYPLTFGFSSILSMPTFIVYNILFHYLKKTDLQTCWVKFLLIGITILGITLTMLVVGSGFINGVMVAYSITAIIIGFILRLRPGQTGESGKYFIK